MNKKIFSIFCVFMSALLILPLNQIASAAPIPEEYISNEIIFYKKDDVVCSSVSATGVSGDSNQAKIWGWLINNGLTPEQAAGVMGNIQAESGFSPTRHEGGKAWGSGGWGLAQWTFERRTKIANAIPSDLKKYYNQTYGGSPNEKGQIASIPVEDNDKLLIFELEYLMQESISRKVTARGYTKGGSEWEFLKTMSSVEDATVFWHNNFEVSNDSAARVIQSRGGAAKKIYETFKGSTPQSSSSSSSGSTNVSSSSSKITFIGDSITAGMKSDLSSAFSGANVEAEVGKGISWVNSRLKSGMTLNDTVVINIGTNDNFPVNEAKTMLDLLKDKKVYLVNNFGKGGNVNFVTVNNGINVAAKGRSNVKILDWKAEVEAKAKATNVSDRSFYEADGYHINKTSGKELYIAFLKKSIGGSSDNKAGECSDSKTEEGGSGDLSKYVKMYAWPSYSKPNINRKPEYAQAISTAKSEGRYVGDYCHGGGVDCGGFTTTLIYDSGYDKEFNSKAKGGSTIAQESWMKRNWQALGKGSTINVADLKPGDVAVNPKHTFIYVGEIDGFNSKIASASQCVRAPMAGKESLTSADINWYRKK